MPKWFQYLDEDELDDEQPRANFQKIKKKNERPDEMGKSSKKKPKPQRIDISTTG